MKLIQNRNLHLVVVRLGLLGLCLVAAGQAAAQIEIGFEPPDYNGSAQGVVVTGQAGWYRPDVIGATDHFVYTYEGNELGLPANALGETQFLGAMTARLGDFPRAQLNFDWSTAAVWTVSYDFAARLNGPLPAVDNLGSFSLQDSLVARHFIAVNTWANPSEGTLWNANYIAFTAGDVQMDPIIPGPQWMNLAVDHWYRQSTTFDFDSNTIVSVSITDLDTGDTATFAPTGWYLRGGATGGPPLPTALRFFVGGGDTATGNVMGFDNLLVVAGGAGAAPNRAESGHPQSIKLKAGSVTQ